MAQVQVPVRVAKESFTCHIGDELVFVRAGDVARVGHPVLKGREHLFGPLRITFDAPTAAMRRKAE